MARPAIVKRKYPEVRVGGYSAPVDTSGLDAEMKATMGIGVPKKKPKSTNPVGDWFRKTFGGQ